MPFNKRKYYQLSIVFKEVKLQPAPFSKNIDL